MRTLTERDPVVMNDGSLKQLNEVGGGGGGETYTLPAATANTLGGVKIGDGVNVAEDGTISVSGDDPYTLPTATANTLGGVKIGEGVNVAEDGTISVSGGGGGTKTTHNVTSAYFGTINAICYDDGEYLYLSIYAKATGKWTAGWHVALTVDGVSFDGTQDYGCVSTPDAFPDEENNAAFRILQTVDGTGDIQMYFRNSSYDQRIAFNAIFKIN